MRAHTLWYPRSLYVHGVNAAARAPHPHDEGYISRRGMLQRQTPFLLFVCSYRYCRLAPPLGTRGALEISCPQSLHHKLCIHRCRMVPTRGAPPPPTLACTRSVSWRFTEATTYMCSVDILHTIGGAKETDESQHEKCPPTNELAPTHTPPNLYRLGWRRLATTLSNMPLTT